MARQSLSDLLIDKTNQMEASELRIGNYVTSNTKLLENEVLTVTDINETHVQAWTKGPLGASDEYLEPIPLTEEWLIKFGFECDGRGEIRLPDFIIESFHDGYHYTAGEGCMFGVPILYVHQLQNLYFALTGNELILKP